MAQQLGIRAKKASAQERITTRSLWILLVVILSVLAALRFPLIRDYVGSNFDQELAERVGNESLLNIALTVSSLLAIASYIAAFIAYSILGSLAERKVVPQSIRLSRFKIGIAFFTLTAIAVPLQLGAIVAQSPTISRGVFSYAWIALVALLASYLFRKKGMGLSGWWPGALVSVGIGAALCIQ